MVLLGTIINLVEEQTGKKMLEDPETYAEVKDAVSVVMKAFGPTAPTYAKGLRSVFATSIGRDAVEKKIGDLLEPDAEQRSRSKPKG